MQFLNAADEININYHENLNTLYDFAKEHEKQRLNLTVDNIETFLNNNELPLIHEIRKKGYNITVKITDHVDEKGYNIIYQLKEYDIPFYFSTPCININDLYHAAEVGVSDVYLSSPLVFNMIDVTRILKDSGIQVRVYPSFAQADWVGEEDYTKFFIRPEDVYLYEPYVDIFEYVTVTPEQEEGYYLTYHKSMFWSGDIRDLILDLENFRSNEFIPSSFARMRLICQKVCATGKTCHLCKTLYNAAEKFDLK